VEALDETGGVEGGGKGPDLDLLFFFGIGVDRRRGAEESDQWMVSGLEVGR
jgi:hypothetical protein